MLKKTATIIVGCIVGLSLGEGVLRVSGVTDSFSEQAGIGKYQSEFDARSEMRPHTYSISSKWKVNGKEVDYYFNTNSEGLNDAEWSLKKSNRVKLRALFIGDSFTDNIGGDGYSFEKAIVEKTDSLEIMSAGVGGSDPFFEYELFTEKLMKYHPDMVFVLLNISDITDVIVRGGSERFGTDGKLHYNPPPWWEQVYAHVHLVRAVAKAFLSRQFLFRGEEKPARRKAMDKIEKCLDKFQTKCDENGMKCVFVFVPVKSEIKKGVMETDSILRYVRRANYQVIDLLDFFSKKGVSAANADSYYGVYDGHHNRKGYALIAEGFQSYFKDSLGMKVR